MQCCRGTCSVVGDVQCCRGMCSVVGDVQCCRGTCSVVGITTHHRRDSGLGVHIWTDQGLKNRLKC